MTNQAITIIDELVLISPEAFAAMEALAKEIVTGKKAVMDSLSPKSDAVLRVATPRGWEIVNAALAKGDMEITVPPTSYEDVLERNIAFLTRKIELMKVILNNLETGYRKYEMSEELDKCETIEEMNEMILE